MNSSSTSQQWRQGGSWVLFLGSVLVIVFAIGQRWLQERSLADFCVSHQGVTVCAASDMAKLRDRELPTLEHPRFNLADSGRLVLTAARNETVAFQLIVRRRSLLAPAELEVELAELTSARHRLPASYFDWFKAWYHPVLKGGHLYGADSEVLPWPGHYPDALVPATAGCFDRQTTLLPKVTLAAAGHNTNLWFDLFIPRGQPIGNYQSTIKLILDDGSALEIPLELRLLEATLPDRPSIEAVGELYRSYALEGVGKARDSARWIAMAHCYQQLAHRHRMVFLERWDDIHDVDWPAYIRYAGPILDGSLFSKEYGYRGTGENTPVAIWRTPWEQGVDFHLTEMPSPEELDLLARRAARFQQEVEQQGWLDTDYFAYIYDELVGPTDETQSSDDSDDYVRRAHTAMHQAQAAIDRGADRQAIDLIWTSHSDPRRWQNIPGLDLRGTVRFWAPNGSAAAPDFLASRQQYGERIWFYHDGHPAVGIHSVNASGIEMRSWGLITARYRFDGHFMWALNLGQDEAPFRMPNYLLGDDRYGNGVMVYPGKQLPKIGYEAVPGPLPSMRLKAWRRGLQDAELITLARQNGHAEKVDALLEQLIPVALGAAIDQGQQRAQWSRKHADWIDFREQALQLASQPLQ